MSPAERARAKTATVLAHIDQRLDLEPLETLCSYCFEFGHKVDECTEIPL